jgi:F-type H+-transporting ATPase subunit a
MYSKICKVLLIPAMLFLTHSVNAFSINSEKDSQQTIASEQAESHEVNPEGEGAEKFNPGDFMFDHIKDAHEWHILSIGKTHVSIPLPVIIYSKNSGLHVFMSSKFKHGHETYKGFHLELTGENKGKILEEDGTKPFDISITKNVAAMLFSITLLLLVFVSVGNMYRKNPLQAPRGLQTFVEPIVTFLRDEVIKPSIGPKYERYMPYLLTIFFFIWINNMLGLIPIPPGGANLTGNIAVTMTLALFTFIITTFSGNKSYWQHIVNTPGVPVWLKMPLPIIPLVEVIGVFTKPFVLMVRLFANITAGHIIALGFISLIYIFAQMSHGLAYGVSIISVAFNVFMMFLELLVAFIQAFVFTFLSSIYFGMAVEEHHHDNHEAHEHA